MHNHDDTYPVLPRFELAGTSRLQALQAIRVIESFYLELCYFKFRELGVPGTWELEVPGTWELEFPETWELRNLKFRELRNLGALELTLGCPLLWTLSTNLLDMAVWKANITTQEDCLRVACGPLPALAFAVQWSACSHRSALSIYLETNYLRGHNAFCIK